MNVEEPPASVVRRSDPEVVPVWAMVTPFVGSLKVSPKFVIRASVIELAPTEPTTNALFSNLSSILLKLSDDV